MKKVLLTLIAVAVAVAFVGTAIAAETVKVKESTKQTATGTVKTEKIVEKTPAGKEKVKEEVTTTKTGTERDALVIKDTKKGDVAREKVIFKSYTNENGGTITVIKDKKEVRMQARHMENWKANVLGKENKEITITSSYDPKLLKHVVTHVE